MDGLIDYIPSSHFYTPSYPCGGFLGSIKLFKMLLTCEINQN